MKAALQSRAAYRSFLRNLYRLTRPHPPNFINLRRLYRPHLRQLLLDPEQDLDEVTDKFESTLSLLQSNPALLRNLSSLSYHHTPYQLPHTPNSSRLSHLPRPIDWKPQDPDAARKAWDKRKKDQDKDPALKVGRKVDELLRRLLKEAEKEENVLLGKIEARRYGDV